MHGFAHATHRLTAPVSSRPRRGRGGRRRRTHRRAVDDQHRHRRHRRDGRAGRGARPRRLRARPHHRRSRRGGQGRAAHPRPPGARAASIAPLVGDFHYNGHTLLADNPAAAEALDKYRINPGNVGFKDKKDRQFAAIIDTALRWKKPVRIGVNWGSLDQELLTRLMDENARSQRAEGCARRDARGDRAVGAHLRAARRGAGPHRRRHHSLGQGLGGAGSRQRLHDAGRAQRLRAARRSHRSRHGLKGHRRLDRRHRPAAAGRHRRHHPRLADARARRRSHARGEGGAGDPAVDGPAVVHARRHRLPRVRAHDLDRVPGARPQTCRT